MRSNSNSGTRRMYCTVSNLYSNQSYGINRLTGNVMPVVMIPKSNYYVRKVDNYRTNLQLMEK